MLNSTECPAILLTSGLQEIDHHLGRTEPKYAEDVTLNDSLIDFFLVRSEL